MEKMVESEIIAWSKYQNWDLDVMDSKGQFSQALGRYTRNSGLKKGTSDLLGNTDCGIMVAIELKKRGHRDKCRIEQYRFLVRKIKSNSFGLVTDSKDHLSEVYKKWLCFRGQSFDAAQKFLLEQLPKKVLVKNGKSFKTIPAPFA